MEEGNDNTDVVQMCVFVRYFDGKQFKEDLLAVIQLEAHTTGDIIFTKLSEVNLLVKDGTSAMVGKQRGLVSRLREVTPKIQGLYSLPYTSEGPLCQAKW